jgi:hypothetical protein
VLQLQSEHITTFRAQHSRPPRGQDRRVSRRGESHPPPLSGPDVTVSRHPAPTVRPQVNAISCQWANRPGLYW